MNFNEIEVRIDKPYPRIVGAKQDPITIGILKNLAMSKKGELIAVLTYIYQSVIADKTNEDIAKIFEEVAVVEMMHLDMLMHAITAFGGNPKYEDAHGNFLSTMSVNYNTKLKDMLEANIAGESMTAAEYREATKHVTNESLKDLLTRIAQDEDRHLEIFKQIKNGVEFLSV